MRKQYGALVVGAGIGGIRSALDLAVTGQRVALIDRRPNHGGILAQLDFQFPSDHCGMCKMLPLMARDSSSQYCLRKGLFHENIDILLSTELVALEGDPGMFLATLRQRSTLVDPNKCISCGLCSEVCPVKVPSEFNAGMTTRSAIHLPVPHNIPNHYVVDLDNCLRCWRCVEACPTGAINFLFEERKDFNILVADNDPKTGEFLGDWLKAQNFPIHSVASGAAAVDLLAERDDFRLLFLDAGLGDMDPEKVLARARDLRPDLSVVVMASPGQEEAARGLLAQGAREVLAKPMAPKTLVPWLDKLYMRIMSDLRLELEVGAVILAAGFECYDPSEVADTLGYGVLPGVVTALEFERLASGTGPTGGAIVNPATGRPARKIAWIQCVGSRDLRKKADFCSSICCMFSIKEALLAKKISGGEAETTIFSMDMRTFGKDFQRYRDRAEEEQGVRFVRCRPHSVLPDGPEGGLKLCYFAEDRTLREEVFDLVVLATGARPPAGMRKLAATADIATNAFGFCETKEFSPARTSRLGVYASGAFAGPKDIAESVIQAGAAAQSASRIIKVYDVLTGKVVAPEPEYPDVSRLQPRTLIALCTSCPTLEMKVDMEDLAEKLARVHSVCRVLSVHGACTRAGWEEIKEQAKEYAPNRVLIGACMPYAYVPKLRELGRTIGLNPALMDVVDIHTEVFPEGTGDEAAQERRICSTLSAATAKLMGADPVPAPVTVDVARMALVVGGGLAGMTAAMAIGDQGHQVCLVEESDRLGGLAMRLHYTLEGSDPRKFMQDLIEQVERHPNIRVLKNSRVVLSSGNAGRFRTAIASEIGTLSLEHGVTILATGGREAKVYEYGFRVHKSVLTHLELEEKLATGVLDTSKLKTVAMIQCWRSREGERNYCSRVCCPEALKNILFLKRKNPDITIVVFYRDIMSPGFMETYYTQARKAGAIFVRYDLDNKPRVSFEDGLPVILARDPVLDRDIEVRPDLLVLSSGIEPNDHEDEALIFGVDVDQDGFFQEAESKWRPVDFLKQGVFMCGLARGPGSMRDTIASAKAAAQRSLLILSAEKIARETVVATVRHSLCSLCRMCIEVCPYGARRVDPELERIVVDEILCQGCGSCAAICPNSATVLKGFHDSPVMASIDAVLEEIAPAGPEAWPARKETAPAQEEQ